MKVKQGQIIPYRQYCNWSRASYRIPHQMNVPLSTKRLRTRSSYSGTWHLKAFSLLETPSWRMRITSTADLNCVQRGLTLLLLDSIYHRIWVEGFSGLICTSCKAKEEAPLRVRVSSRVDGRFIEKLKKEDDNFFFETFLDKNYAGYFYHPLTRCR